MTTDADPGTDTSAPEPPPFGAPAPGGAHGDRPGGTPPGPGAPPPSTKDIRPSVAWYWIGAALLVLGIVGGFALIVGGAVEIADAPDDYERISVPGERTLNFAEPGTYTFFGEADYYSSYGTYSSSYNTINPPEVTVKNAAGTPMAISREYPSGSSDYSRNGYRGYSFASVYIATPGPYTVDIREPEVEDVVDPPRSSRTSRTTVSYQSRLEVIRVAVGMDRTGSGLGKVGFGFLLGTVGVIAGLVVLVVAGVKRSGSRRRLFPPPPRLAPYGPYGAYGGAPYGAGPYGAPPGPYGAPPGPFGAPPGPFGAPPGPYGAPPGPYGAPPGPYGAPPPFGQPPPPAPGPAAPSGPPAGSPVGPPGSPPPPANASWTLPTPPPLPPPWQQPAAVPAWPAPGTPMPPGGPTGTGAPDAPGASDAGGRPDRQDDAGPPRREDPDSP